MPSRIIYLDMTELEGLSLYKALRKLREIQTNTPQPFKDALKVIRDHDGSTLIVAEQVDVERIAAMQEKA